MLLADSANENITIGIRRWELSQDIIRLLSQLIEYSRGIATQVRLQSEETYRYNASKIMLFVVSLLYSICLKSLQDTPAISNPIGEDTQSDDSIIVRFLLYVCFVCYIQRAVAEDPFTS